MLFFGTTYLIQTRLRNGNLLSLYIFIKILQIRLNKQVKISTHSDYDFEDFKSQTNLVTFQFLA